MRRHRLFSRLVYIAYFVIVAGFMATFISEMPTVADEITFPYKARIASDDVYVRSGPGRNYYPTDKLRVGEEVEIFRHDPGGWYAIRPPRGSFSWISSRFVRLGRDGLAEIVGDRVAARVGSRFSDIRDVVQVRLHEGEVVELRPSSTLDPSDPSSPVPDNSQKWIKIAPPSGEFRWISAEYVDRNYENSGIRKAPLGPNPLTGPASGRERDDYQNAPPPGFSRRPLAGDGALSALSPQEFQKRLEDADLELSVMVAEEPSVWRFDELALEAESLMNRAETAVQRGHARVLLGKIDRFTNIKQRYDAVNTLWEDTQNRNEQLADLRRQYGSNRPGITPENAVADNRFDGYGRLTRVVSPKQGAPRYALVDESGNVQCYVTPAPGVNLRHYEQRLIGVNGTRGYVPEQRAAHIMAQHVDLIDDARGNSGTRLR